MHKILSLTSLILFSLVLSACSSKSSATNNSAPNATAQPVVEERVEWKDLSRTSPNFSIKYPSNATVTDAPAGNALHRLSLDFSDKVGNEELYVSVLRAKLTKADLEDLETDLYNGKERKLGTLTANCYVRTHQYIRDQYTFLNRRYAGNAPQQGYRLDCTAALGTNTLYVQYQNDTNDLALFRKREAVAEQIISSAR